MSGTPTAASPPARPEPPARSRGGLRHADLAAIALALALAISLLVSAQLGEIDGNGANAGTVSGGQSGTAIAESGQSGAARTAEVTSPSAEDVEITEDTPVQQPDGSYLIEGEVRNRNALWTLEVVEIPRIKVLDVQQAVVGEGPIELTSTTLPPGSTVRWRYVTRSLTGQQPVVSFERSELRGRWLPPG